MTAEAAGARAARRGGQVRLHPLAWLAWLAGAAGVAAALGNPLYQLPLLGVLAAVYLAGHADAPWARAFPLFLRLGAVVLVLRTLLAAAGGDATPPVLLRLPQLRLPGGAVALGGPVSAGALATGFRNGLTVLLLIAAFGAFNACVSPSRLLRMTPGFLFEAGLVVTVALAFVPQTVLGVQRTLEAQRLRGHRLRRPRDLGPLLLPVLAGGLERALTLAEAMEARGYGRHRPGAGQGRDAALVGLAGLVAVLLGVFALLAGNAAWSGRALLGIGAVAVAAAATASSRRAGRTRLRGERWTSGDTAVAAAAGAALLLVLAARVAGIGDLGWAGAARLAAPGFAVLPALAVLALAAPVAAGGPR
jgi:energy-coupling factor transport system permease protein